LQSVPDDHSPLSYADLRRFLGLLLLLGVSGLLVWRLADVILLFAVIFLMAMVLNPVVAWLQRRGIGRGLAVMVVILGLIGILGAVMWLIVPVVMEQVNQLVQKAPQYGASIREQAKTLGQRYPSIEQYIPETEKIIEVGRNQASGAVSWVLKSTFGLVGAVFTAVVALLLLVFTLSSPGPIVAGFLAVIPERHRSASRRSVVRMMEQMAAWIKATLINGFITGTLTGALLLWIGVQPAFVFGILAFFGEFVPNIGPIATSAPALFVALGSGAEKAGLTLAAIMFVQMVSGNILVPMIMGREMELHPVAIVFFALGMGSLFGVVGAILAVPAAAGCKILIDEFYLKPQREKGQLDEVAVQVKSEKLLAGALGKQPEVVEEKQQVEANATVSKDARMNVTGTKDMAPQDSGTAGSTTEG
jgi:predicted PurR-regulated permease PerM